MKTILMSIQPKWCELIASGQKTIEVRKTAPKAPFRAFIYQTKKKWIYRLLEWLGLYQQKIIGEFICDKVICLTHETKIPTVKQNEDGTLSIVGYTTTEPFYNGRLSTIKGSCLEQEQLLSYGKGKTLYGYHITALKIYDKPRELSEFKGYCNKKENCYKDIVRHCNDMHFDWKCKSITRPPQSWMYCEPPKDLEVME